MRPRLRRFSEKFIHKHPMRTVAVAVLCIILIGTIVFQLSEWRRFLDALYFMIMTVTTIGYGDYVPITPIGKIIAIIFAIIGVPIFIGIVGLIFEARFKKSINKHMNELEKELMETEEKLEETENKLLTEEKKLVKIGKETKAEKIEAKKWFMKKLFWPK